MIRVALLLGALYSSAVFAMPGREAIYDTRKKSWLTVEELAASMEPNTIVVFGEEHAPPESDTDSTAIRHQENQWRWLNLLNSQARERSFHSRLGLEFLEYTHQREVEDYLAQKLSEEEFLKSVGWGENPFTPYKRLMWETQTGGTIALNIPREVSGKVARSGRESLTNEQLALLPPIWELGRAEYYERFAATMIGHVPEEKIERYFWAQSLWDDTMAWNATRNMGAADVLTIIVGYFHAEFGHGLPSRLKRYGAQNVKTLIQVAMAPGESVASHLAPDPLYGDRADYLWVYFLD